MACTKHPIRKRKDCPDCVGEINDSGTSKKEVVIKNDPVKEIQKDKPKEKRGKLVKVEEPIRLPMLQSTPSPQIAGGCILPPMATASLSLEDVKGYIDKQLKAGIKTLIESEARETIASMVETAIKSYGYKLKEMAEIKQEHLFVPLSKFNMALWNKLEKDGWGYRDCFKGEIAKVSGHTTDVVVLVRYQNPKWPKKPEF